MNQRIHSLDAARAIFLLMGIPFHVATKSIFGLPTPLEPLSSSAVIAVFMSFTHAFRMFGFFLISGYFSALIIQKRGRPTWMRDRLNRVAIPLVCSVLTVGVLQFYMQAKVIGSPSETLLGLPIRVDHLWFLAVLLLFSGTLYLLPVERFSGGNLVAKGLELRGLPGVCLILALAGWGLMRSLVDKWLPDDIGGSIVSHFIYHAPAFAMGAAACFGSVGSRIFTYANRWHALVAMVGAAAYICLDTLARSRLGLPAAKTVLEKLASNAMDVPMGLLLSLVAFSVLNHLIRRRYAVVDFLVAGAMSIYIFHMIWTLLAIKALTYTIWPGLLQWLAGSMVVFALSTFSYLLVRQNRWLSMAFVGTGIPKAPQPVAAE